MAIPDFSDEQLSVVQGLLATRYGEAPETHLADSEVTLNPEDTKPTLCPVLFWSSPDCNFAVMRTGENAYQAQYFFTPEQHFATTQAQFTTLEDAVTAVLRTQADHQRELAMAADAQLSKDSH